MRNIQGLLAAFYVKSANLRGPHDLWMRSAVCTALRCMMERRRHLDIVETLSCSVEILGSFVGMHSVCTTIDLFNKVRSSQICYSLL